MTLSKSQRAAVREMFGGCCAYCGSTLEERWPADHVEPVFREWYKRHRPKTTTKLVDGKIVEVPTDRRVGMERPENDVIENFYPACVPCNIDKSRSKLEDWRRYLQQKIGVALRNSTPLRHAERFGLVQFSDAPIVFHFEKFIAPPKAATGDE